MPITSCPCSVNSAAVTDESTPPLMATAIRFGLFVFSSISELPIQPSFQGLMVLRQLVVFPFKFPDLIEEAGDCLGFRVWHFAMFQIGLVRA